MIGERRSAGLRGLGGLKPCARSAGKKHGGNRKSQGALARSRSGRVCRRQRTAPLCEFPGRFRFTALKGRNRVAPFRLGCSASLSRPQGALGFDPPLNPLRTPLPPLKRAGTPCTWERGLRPGRKPCGARPGEKNVKSDASQWMSTSLFIWNGSWSNP